MKLNPKIAKQPDDLQNLEFKKMKTLIKKELKRLEKYTSKEKPTQCILLGAHPYKDKPDMALPLFGKWIGKFKEYAKKTVVKDPMGAIGLAYYGGIDEESGQKVLRINLAKGKGKTKTNKMQRTLKKLIPQASFNVVFGEISEEEMAESEQAIEATVETVEEEITDVDLLEGLDVETLLTSNLKEISSTFATLKKEIVPKIKAKKGTRKDADLAINLDDLILEWMELYKTAPEDTQLKFKKYVPQITGIRNALKGILAMFSNTQGMVDEMNEQLEKNTGEVAPILGSGDHIIQPDSTSCYWTSRKMVETFLKKNNINMTIPTGWEDSIQIAKQADAAGTKYIPVNPGGAVDYINKCLAKGLPVIVGVSLFQFVANYNADGTTDHFIVIIGSTKEGGSPGFYYMDPANYKGDETSNNILVQSSEPGKEYLWQDPNSPLNLAYVLVSAFKYAQNIEGVEDQSVDGIEGVINKSVGAGGANSFRDVVIVQKLLVASGEDLGAFGPNKDGVDGDAGATTQNAIKRFQAKNGLEQTGIIAPDDSTWLMLYGQGEPDDLLDQEYGEESIEPSDVKFQLNGSVKNILPKQEAVLRELLAAAGEGNVAIVNTLRTAEEQASIMYMNIQAYGAAFNRTQYNNPAGAAKVVDAYEKAVAAGKEEKEIIGAMLVEINAVGAATLSDHCNSSNPAIGIHPSSIKNKAKFEKVMKGDSRCKIICPPNDTQYHIVIK